MRRYLFIAALTAGSVAATVVGCRQAQKTAYLSRMGDNIALAPAPAEGIPASANEPPTELLLTAAGDIAVMAQSCPGMDWRGQTNRQTNSKVSRADVILASLTAADADGTEILCLQGDWHDASAVKGDVSAAQHLDVKTLEMAMAQHISGPELSWRKAASLQAAAITPAEILVCMPAEPEPVATPPAEPRAKEKKDAQATEFEWDPREWVESIFADSRPVRSQAGEKM